VTTNTSRPWRQAAGVCLQHCGEVGKSTQLLAILHVFVQKSAAIPLGAGTYAVEVVAGVLAVEVAGAVLDVAIEHGGLLGACDQGEHCAVIEDC
jgi:hypothetical protein